LFAYRVDLEQRVRTDHPLRRVAAVVDFSFVRDQVAPCYGYNGHVSVDPVVILKLMFLLFYDDVPSERELLSRLGERLDYLWFLGYGLDDPIPDHGVLSKAHRRWGGKSSSGCLCKPSNNAWRRDWWTGTRSTSTAVCWTPTPRRTRS
jgi:hypothetical protein